MSGISTLRLVPTTYESAWHHESSAGIARWAREGGLHERRLDAAQRMQDCLRDESPLLILDGLGLSSLPPEIGRFTFLRALHVNDNQLEHLPESIGNLSALKVLYLNQNRLSQLPETLGQLGGLEVLNAHSNRLTRLPESFAQLTHLRLLWLHGNPLETLPGCLLRLPPSALEDLPLLQAGHSQLVHLQEKIATAQALESLAARLSSQTEANVPALPPDIWRSLREALVECSPNSSTSLRGELEAWLKQAAQLAHRDQPGVRPVGQSNAHNAS